MLFVFHNALKMKGNRKSELLIKSMLPEKAGYSFFNGRSGLEEDQLKYFLLFLEWRDACQKYSWQLLNGY